MDVALRNLPGSTVKAWFGATREVQRVAGVVPAGAEDVGASIVDGTATLAIPAGSEAIAFVLDGAGKLLTTRVVMAGINRDAQVWLQIPTVITAKRGVVASYLTKMVHEGPAMQAMGRIGITGTGLTAAKVALVQKDFNGPGQDLTVPFTDLSPGVVQGEYGPFPLLGDQHGQTTNEVTFDASLAPQSMAAVSTMFDLNGVRIGQSMYSFNVTV